MFAIVSLSGLHRRSDRCRSNSGTHGGHGGGRCRGREQPRWRNSGEQGRAAELEGGRRCSGGWGAEGGGGVARKLLRDDVVLLVLLVGVEGLCGVGSMARPSGGGSSGSPA
jgi:hypothetical protein